MHIHVVYLTVFSAPDAAYSVTKKNKWCAIATFHFGTAESSLSVRAVKEGRIGTGFVVKVKGADPGVGTKLGESFRYGAQGQEEKRLY